MRRGAEHAPGRRPLRCAVGSLAVVLGGCAGAAPQPGSSPFLGLSGVVYPGAQDAAVAWYAALLDAPVRTPILGTTAFAVDAAQLDLDPAAPVPFALWRVADMDAAFQRLTARGAEPVTGIQEIGAVHVAIFRDPFGNLLAITDADAAHH
jgi:predicted enzyme related to lactoylglutathione lyase